MVFNADLSDLDMSQYPTMQLIFSDAPGKPKTPGKVQSPDQENNAVQVLSLIPTSNIGQPSTPGTPATFGTPGTPGTPAPFGTPTTTPGTPASSVGAPRTSGRSGSGSTKEGGGSPFNNAAETMTKEEEEKKLHFRLEIRPDDGTSDSILPSHTETLTQTWSGYYVGGVFKFRFDIPDTYPHDPPKVKCEQKVNSPYCIC